VQAKYPEDRKTEPQELKILAQQRLSFSLDEAAKCDRNVVASCRYTNHNGAPCRLTARLIAPVSVMGQLSNSTPMEQSNLSKRIKIVLYQARRLRIGASSW